MKSAIRRPKAGGAHPGDDELGIHYTSQRLADGPAGVAGTFAGSMAYVMKATGKTTLYRLCDGASENVDLSKAREVK